MSMLGSKATCIVEADCCWSKKEEAITKTNADIMYVVDNLEKKINQILHSFIQEISILNWHQN